MGLLDSLFGGKKNVEPEYVPNKEWVMQDWMGLPHNKREAQIIAPQYLKQMKDSLKLVKTTTNPEVFFQRYDFLIGRMDCLSECSKYIRFSGEQPKQSAKLLHQMNQRNAAVENFIDRYAEKTKSKMQALKTEKARQNVVEKFRQSLYVYEKYISTESLAHLEKNTESCCL